MPELLFLLFMLAFSGAGWLMLKRYERYLDAQMGPWITASSKNGQTRSDSAHRHR